MSDLTPELLAHPPARHGVFGIAVFQLDYLQEQLLDVFAELGGPQLRVFHFDRVDQVNT